MRFKRTALIGCLSLLAILCLVYAGTWFIVRTERFQSWLETRVRDAGTDLSVGEITLSFPFDLVVSRVSAASPGAFDFSSREIRADLNPLALASGQLTELVLVEPRLRVSLASPAGRTAGAPPGLLVKSLTVQDGSVTFETGGEERFTIPRINLTGQDLDLGSQSGAMETVAFLPELDANLKMRLTADASGLSAHLEIRQRHAGEDTAAAAARSLAGEGEVSLAFAPDAGIQITGRMRFDRFAFKAVTYTGQVTLSAETRADRDVFAIEAKAESTHLSGLLPLEDTSALFPVSAAVTGDYRMSSQQLALSDIRIAFPLATLTGRAQLSLDEEARLTEGVFEMQKIALDRLQALLPAGQAKALSNLEGALSAQVTLAGGFDPWSFSGVLKTRATGTAAAGASVGEIEGTLPFAVRAGDFQAEDLRLSAKELRWRGSEAKLEAGLASLTVHGSARQAAGRTPSFNGRMEFRGGRFATDDGLAAAEKIQGRAALELELEGPDTVRVRLDVALASMELLWHRFFADFKPEQPELAVSATYAARTGTLAIQRSRVGLTRIGAVDLDGKLVLDEAMPAFDVRLRTAGIRLANFYDFFIRETFKTSQPLIEELRVGGTARADVAARGQAENFTVEGRVQLEALEVGRADAWGIGPIAVTLPLKLAYPERQPPAASGTPPAAGVSVAGLRFGRSEIPPFTVFLSLWNNTLTLVRPLQISIYDGAVMVERLAWQDIVARPRRFSFSGRIDDVSLAAMTKDLDWYQFDGSISGVIPEVNWAEDTLRTDGALEVRVFDGQIRLDELEIRGLAGLVPNIKVNVDIRDINLERVTKVFEFGTIAGILAGKVDGLVISNGQPSQFQADIHTVSKPGVSQWISVEALNKIVVLGSGTEGSAPYGLLAGLFDYYRYRRIGFKARLRNDLLLLEGIKSQDGKEFLVEGSLIPPTVNVVSHMQRISFKELVSRLERIAEIGPPADGAPGS